MPTMQALPADHPEMKAWERYRKSDEYDNSSSPEHIANYTEGSLWAAFDEGWRAAMETPANTAEAPVIQHILSRNQRDSLISANVWLSHIQAEFGEESSISHRIQKTINIISDMLYGDK